MLGRPHASLRSIIEAILRSAEGENRMVVGHPVEDAAHDLILIGHDVAADEYNRRPVSLPHIMKPHAIDSDEPALGRAGVQSGVLGRCCNWPSPLVPLLSQRGSLQFG